MSEAIIVALIAAVIGPTVVALVQQRRSHDDLSRRLGEPNGHGSLVAMVQSVIAGQADQDGRIAHLEDRVGRTEARIGSLHERVVDLETTPGLRPR